MTTSNEKIHKRISRPDTDAAPRGERCVRLSQVLETVRNGTPPFAESDSGERGLLRPGYDVRVDEHSSNAVLMKSPSRLKPGTRTDLQLLDRRRILRGEIDRCRVSRLEPLCYEAIFVFHESVAMAESDHV